MSPEPGIKSNLKSALLAACAVVSGTALLSAAGCSKNKEEPDDETKIRNIIEQAAAMAENHDINGLMDLTTEYFTAEPGQRDRQAVRGILFMVFRKYGTFSVKFPRPMVDVKPGSSQAKATTPFLIVRKGTEAPNVGDLYDDPKGWLEKVGKAADLYTIELWFEKGGEDWRVHETRLLGYRSMYDN
jgi:hypothetical protein